MPKGQGSLNSKSVLFLLCSFFLTIFLAITSVFYLRIQNKLWKSELTRKAVLTALSYASAVADKNTFNESIKRLVSTVEEISEINIFELNTEGKFQIIASNLDGSEGQTLISPQLEKVSREKTPLPLLETERVFNNGRQTENHYVNVYTPLPLENLFLHLKLSTSDVELIRTEDKRLFFTGLVVIIFLILWLGLLSVWQLNKGWNLYTVWKASAQSKDELLSMAAHEMNAPLTAIKASLSVFNETYAAPLQNQGRELINKASSICQSLIDSVEEILTVSRFERDKIEIYPRPIFLSEVIAQIVQVYKEKAHGKNLEINFESFEEIPKIVADPEKIKEVIGNFISNAIKYSHWGTINLLLETDKNSVSLHVSDQGDGIKAEDLIKLFQRFTRLKSTSQERGTGLGLYISRLIIEAHGGRIWAESMVGQGSKFSFSLPIPKKLPNE